MRCEAFAESQWLSWGRMGEPGEAERPWPPTKILEYEDTIGTNMGPAVVWTDAGRAYVKPMAADINPHQLAMELLCTRLAAWFGLPVLDACVLVLARADTFERRPLNRERPERAPAIAGPSFVTRAVPAVHWDRREATLRNLVNPHSIAELVAFDTWTRNDDRYPPINASGEVSSSWGPNAGNVLLVRDPPGARSLRLIAMDFDRALIGGGRIPAAGFGIDQHQDEFVYGLYPEFRPFITRELVQSASRRLKEVDRRVLNSVTREIPDEWEVDARARKAIAEHLYRRARHVADTIESRLEPLCFPHGRMPW